MEAKDVKPDMKVIYFDHDSSWDKYNGETFQVKNRTWKAYANDWRFDLVNEWGDHLTAESASNFEPVEDNS